MEDGDFMTNHLNVFNTMVIQLIFVDIKMEEEDKCITLLCSLPNSCDNLVVAIGSSTKSALKFEDIVASLLSEEMRRKSMENHITDALSMTFVIQRKEESLQEEDINLGVDLNLQEIL